MKWRLHDNVREYIYEHLVVKEDKHYKELSDELGISDANLRDLKMEEQGIRDGTLVIHRGESDIRLVTVQELLDKTFNYAFESNKRRTAMTIANSKIVAENKRRERLGVDFTDAVTEAMKVKEQSILSKVNRPPLKGRIESKKIVQEEVQVVQEERVEQVVQEERVEQDLSAEDKVNVILTDENKVVDKVIETPMGETEGAQMARLYSEEYWTMSQLQEKFGYGIPKVRDILIAEGVEIRPRAVLLSKDRKDELLEHLEREPDKSIEYFVKLYQLSEATIKSYQANVRGERNKVGLKSKSAFRKLCKVLKAQPQLSFYDAALQENVSPNVLNRIYELLEAEGFDPKGKPVEIGTSSGQVESVVLKDKVVDGKDESMEILVSVEQDEVLSIQLDCEGWRKRALVAEQEVKELKLKQQKLLQAHAEFLSAVLL